MLGTLRSTTATATKTSLQNVTLHNPKPFAIISSRSLRTMWANYPKIELIRAVSEQNYRMKDSHLYARVVVKTSNSVISRCCYAEYPNKMRERYFS